MMFYRFIAYFLILCASTAISCTRCPDLASPHVLVVFEGNFNFTSIKGVGGGAITWQGKDTTAAGKQLNAYLLELSVNTGTTTYIFERINKKDTLTFSARYNSFYSGKCGFYMQSQELKVKQDATSFPNITSSSSNSYNNLTPPYEDSFSAFYIQE